MEEAKESQNDQKAKTDAMTVEIDRFRDKIDALFKQKDKLKDDFWKQKYDHEVQREYINYLNGLHSQQKRII